MGPRRSRRAEPKEGVSCRSCFSARAAFGARRFLRSIERPAPAMPSAQKDAGQKIALLHDELRAALLQIVDMDLGLPEPVLKLRARQPGVLFQEHYVVGVKPPPLLPGVEPTFGRPIPCFTRTSFSMLPSGPANIFCTPSRNLPGSLANSSPARRAMKPQKPSPS